jgi:hypothetical protein
MLAAVGKNLDDPAVSLQSDPHHGDRSSYVILSDRPRGYNPLLAFHRNRPMAEWAADR